ncbi:MAG: ABC transporter substrate-binding protein, partial [Desulfuromonadales bacterium]|nr:ABC transporter substrate-binding protein [Desulfuromonadales bacterium]NIS44255.1 ABC transporter substrate-binding protein [Desulfuromonadales bacterium]
MLQVARAITRFNRWIGRWASLAVLIIFVFLLADVIMRYLVGQPTVWTAELATLIFGVYAIIAGGYLLA